MYNVIARNKITGIIDVCELPFDEEAEKKLKNQTSSEKEKKGSRLEFVDSVLSGYKNKAAFLEKTLNELDSTNYDVYIEYNTSGGAKTLDAYFGRNISDISFREKMIQNILESGINDENFIEYLRQDHRDLYKVYDHYDRNNVFQYNNLKKYVDMFDTNSEIKERCFESIKNKISNNYLELRKLVDAAFRYKDPNRKVADKYRKEIDYRKELKSISKNVKGQIELTDFDVFKNNNAVIEKEPLLKVVTVNKALEDHIHKLIENKRIYEAYLEMIDGYENFFDKINEANVSPVLKNATWKYKERQDFNSEDLMEADLQKGIIRKKLSSERVLKFVVKIMNEYIKEPHNIK